MQLIMDSLRYWSSEMGVDGFRFDLAPVLGREPDGYNRQASFFQALAQDPELAGSKLIAEPWDIGPGGYQLGNFPAQWSEWNDSYRDAVRRFWRREPGILPTFAGRLHGSSDIFEGSGRKPQASINFITSHDGFTLRDLVSFNQRHNEANGENNNDGHGENLSDNFGVEGQTDDADIEIQRRRQQRNLLVSLFVSQGVPMLQAGDERNRSQQGNNNAYCQDNQISWIDWSVDSSTDKKLTVFVTQLLQLRRKFPVLRCSHYIHQPPDSDDFGVVWLNRDGEEMHDKQWQDHQSSVLGYMLATKAADDKSSYLLIVFNNSSESLDFTLPLNYGEKSWHWLVDTALESGIPNRPDKPFDTTLKIAQRSVVILTTATKTNN